mmetsp:Transcript_7946/g.18398  ORF Transcript_7946/g.18398 Transcript_7946/m.18398 type:complete len:204 (-) Transcript_7946:1208-1819(-)
MVESRTPYYTSTPCSTQVPSALVVGSLQNDEPKAPRTPWTRPRLARWCQRRRCEEETNPVLGRSVLLWRDTMTRLPSSILVVVAVAALVGAKALVPTWENLDESYTFEQFVRDFDKQYDIPSEWAHRKSIFESNLFHILEHNRLGMEQHGYVLGVNHFMDLKFDAGYNDSFHATTNHWSFGEEQRKIPMASFPCIGKTNTNIH